VRRQCELLRVSRSGLYYEAVATSEEELALMRRIDELHLKSPFYGSRKLSVTLRAEGNEVNRKRVQRLMRLMGLESIAPKPKTSEPHPEHPVYPYLLRNVEVSRPNQVWAADITYIPMRTGFLYLVAIMDWYSRRVLSWRLSNTLDSSFCVEALEEALSRFGHPGIFNTDQGSQFTAATFTDRLRDRGIAISMDGKGRWIDNVFVERLWRSLKYEEVYLHAYDTVEQARNGIGRYLSFFNETRPHQALGYQTPDAFYRGLAHRAADRKEPPADPQARPQVAGLPPAPLGWRPATQLLAFDNRHALP
jgi:putative transposase